MAYITQKADDGWYVLNEDGDVVSGPFDTEDDAEQKAADLQTADDEPLVEDDDT